MMLTCKRTARNLIAELVAELDSVREDAGAFVAVCFGEAEHDSRLPQVAVEMPAVLRPEPVAWVDDVDERACML
jgi:hypothetical protein